MPLHLEQFVAYFASNVMLQENAQGTEIGALGKCLYATPVLGCKGATLQESEIPSTLGAATDNVVDFECFGTKLPFAAFDLLRRALCRSEKAMGLAVSPSQGTTNRVHLGAVTMDPAVLGNMGFRRRCRRIAFQAADLDVMDR
jgi:hypothetical protein